MREPTSGCKQMTCLPATPEKERSTKYKSRIAGSEERLHEDFVVASTDPPLQALQEHTLSLSLSHSEFRRSFHITPSKSCTRIVEMGELASPPALSFKLNTGDSMPAVGLGTWQAAPGVVGEAVNAAITLGYRHIDCASIYRNEKEIGDALQARLNLGLVKREDLWITSKLWCCDLAPEEVPKALDRTLKDLQLEYLDLYLIHWPVRLDRNSNFLPLDIPATWRAMELLLDSGKVRNIGVSNFSSKKLQDLIAHAKILPAVNQVECHPIWQQNKLQTFCTANGIHLSAFSPIGSPGSRNVLKVSVLDHPVVKDIAEKLSRSSAQIALRWGIQSGHSVLPKSTQEDRIRSNFGIFDWSIPEEDMKKISRIEQVRLLRAEFWTNDSTSPYRSVEELWDGEI